MADVYTRIGYIKGDPGAQGVQGVQGDPGEAATIQVGNVTTVPYGQTANVVNSGTEQAAVFDFTIPQGRPGQQTTEMDNLLLNSITTPSASFPIPAVGETGKVLWGKVVKFFSDIRAAVNSKIDTSKISTSLALTQTGNVADATVSKVLNDKITALNDSLVNSQRWKVIAQADAPINSTVDTTITVNELSQYKEVMFSVQRADNGRTLGTTVIPTMQFINGAIYVIGTNRVNDLLISAVGVCVYNSSTSVEIASNKGNPDFAQRFRLFAR